MSCWRPNEKFSLLWMKQRYGHLNHSSLFNSTLLHTFFFPRFFLLYTYHQSGNNPLLPNMIFLHFLSIQTQVIIIMITTLEALLIMWRHIWEYASPLSSSSDGQLCRFGRNGEYEKMVGDVGMAQSNQISQGFVWVI